MRNLVRAFTLPNCFENQSQSRQPNCLLQIPALHPHRKGMSQNLGYLMRATCRDSNNVPPPYVTPKTPFKLYFSILFINPTYAYSVAVWVYLYVLISFLKESISSATQSSLRNLYDKFTPTLWTGLRIKSIYVSPLKFIILWLFESIKCIGFTLENKYAIILSLSSIRIISPGQ